MCVGGLKYILSYIEFLAKRDLVANTTVFDVTLVHLQVLIIELRSMTVRYTRENCCSAYNQVFFTSLHYFKRNGLIKIKF